MPVTNDGKDGKDGDSKDNALDPSKMMAQLMEQNKAITDALTAIKDGSTQQAQALLAKLESLGSSGRSDEDEEDEADDDDDEPDYESMSRKELVKHMEKRLSGVLKSNLKEIKDTSARAVHTADAAAIKQEIRAARDAHADFDEWQKEMGALAKKYGGMEVEDLYTLARNKNPEKAAELDKKYAKDGGKKDDDDGEEGTKKPKFGGFKPGTGRDDNKSGQKFKTVSEAANAAFDRIFGADYK